MNFSFLDRMCASISSPTRDLHAPDISPSCKPVNSENKILFPDVLYQLKIHADKNRTGLAATNMSL